LELIGKSVGPCRHCRQHERRRTNPASLCHRSTPPHLSFTQSRKGSPLDDMM
jgi:hypothetical protein